MTIKGYELWSGEHLFPDAVAAMQLPPTAEVVADER
jgi:hypothetical protein